MTILFCSILFLHARYFNIQKNPNKLRNKHFSIYWSESYGIVTAALTLISMLFLHVVQFSSPICESSLSDGSGDLDCVPTAFSRPKSVTDGEFWWFSNFHTQAESWNAFCQTWALAKLRSIRPRIWSPAGKEIDITTLWSVGQIFNC